MNLMLWLFRISWKYQTGLGHGTPVYSKRHSFIHRETFILCSSRRRGTTCTSNAKCVCTHSAQKLSSTSLVVSVGYMFRYSAAVLKMREIIQQCGPVRAFNARYNCAYATISKQEWWDTRTSGGPIVEQVRELDKQCTFNSQLPNFYTMLATDLYQLNW